MSPARGWYISAVDAMPCTFTALRPRSRRHGTNTAGAEPAPQLASLRVYPDTCTVAEFAQKVSSQHVILCFGNVVEALTDLCALLDIDVIL